MAANLDLLRDAFPGAQADPTKTIELVSPLIRESLDVSWRGAHAQCSEFLQAIADLSCFHLEHLHSEPVAAEDETCTEAGTADGNNGVGGARVTSHARACTACFKLARNLCVGSKAVQEYWWQCGLVSKLDESMKADIADPGVREASWREVAVGFLANTIAGHDDLRTEARQQLFPFGLAAACMLVRHKPELAFILAQNMFVGTGNGPHTGEGEPAETPPQLIALVCTPDGHAIIYLLLALLHGAPIGPDGAKAREWAAIFFYMLWSRGCFAKVYHGIKELMIVRLYYLFCTAAGISETNGHRLRMMDRLANGLCSHDDALGLLWHTIHGLLGGSDDGHSSCGTSADDSIGKLACTLFNDADFALVVAEEFSEALISLASEFSLDLRLSTASDDACAALHINDASEIDVQALAGAARARRREELESEEWRKLGAENDESDGHTVSRSSATLFRDLIAALIQLTAVSPASGTTVPPRLVGVILSGSVAFLDALHRLRFGEEPGEVKTTPPPAVVKVSQTCMLVEHVRLCGNVLHHSQSAQDFLRLNQGLRVLLSNSYADHDLPLLREAGVFAIRNATHQNVCNQEAVRQMLRDRKSNPDVVPDLEISLS